jgi:hypothetical protein
MLQPAIGMILLTFVVWFYMYYQRITSMRALRIGAQRLATPEAAATLLPEMATRPSNNLKNLFEMPVIFYAVCALALALRLEDDLMTGLAWTYVALRACHSAVHCITNHVISRFLLYVGSSLVLLALVLRLAVLGS